MYLDLICIGKQNKKSENHFFSGVYSIMSIWCELLIFNSSIDTVWQLINNSYHTQSQNYTSDYPETNKVDISNI